MINSVYVSKQILLKRGGSPAKPILELDVRVGSSPTMFLLSFCFTENLVIEFYCLQN